MFQRSPENLKVDNTEKTVEKTIPHPNDPVDLFENDSDGSSDSFHSAVSEASKVVSPLGHFSAQKLDKRTSDCSSATSSSTLFERSNSFGRGKRLAAKGVLNKTGENRARFFGRGKSPVVSMTNDDRRSWTSGSDSADSMTPLTKMSSGVQSLARTISSSVDRDHLPGTSTPAKTVSSVDLVESEEKTASRSHLKSGLTSSEVKVVKRGGGSGLTQQKNNPQTPPGGISSQPQQSRIPEIKLSPTSSPTSQPTDVRLDYL